MLKIHSDASYLSEPKGRSRVGGHFYIGNSPPKSEDDNGSIHTKANILTTIVSSASESEYGGQFVNAKAAIPIRQMLVDMGHTQGPTYIY